MSLYDNMPPYHYDTGDFEELRKAYDALEADFNIACSVLDSATTPAKWQGEILDEMIAVVGYGDELPYLSGDEAKREFLFDYLSSMRLMTEEAFKKHVERAFGDAVLVSFASGGTYTNGRNSTDFEPQWEYYPTVLPKYTITINNSRNVYIKVDCSGVTAEYYTPDGVNTHTLAYDRLIGHISETFPIGFRLKLDVNMRPVGVDNEIFIGAVSNVTDAQISETGDKANIYPSWFVYRVLEDEASPSDSDRADCDYTTSPRRYYVQGLWYDEDNITDSGYDFTRSGSHVDLTQTTSTLYVGTFAIPPGIKIGLSDPVYLAIKAGTIRIRFTGTAPNKYARGRWDWLTKCDPNLTNAVLIYDSASNTTRYVGFTQTYVYSQLSQWIEHSFYSEGTARALGYTINTSTRVLTGLDWEMLRGTNDLQLFGTSVIEPTAAIVYIDSNGSLDHSFPMPELIGANGMSNVPGALDFYPSTPELSYYNCKNTLLFRNTRDVDIVVWASPSTAANNTSVGVFPKQPDESHVWEFEWDYENVVEVADEAGTWVPFIPVHTADFDGYLANDYTNTWPSDPSYSMRTRYSAIDPETSGVLPLDYTPTNFTLKEV